MKLGDTREVMLGQYVVAEATVVDLDGDEVYLEIPATRIVMGLKTELGDLEERTPDVDRDVTQIAEGHGGSEAMDEARAELLAAGVELDDDDYTPRSGGGSLHDMKLNDDI